MIQNKFIIITTCYNVAKWLPINIQMMKYQSYENFQCILVDDKSTDNTTETIFKHVDNDPRFQYLLNSNNGSQAKAYMHGIEYLEKHNLISDDDIIVEVDGDDWLASNFVLQYLNIIYQNPKVLMTYGDYLIYPAAQPGGHVNMDLSQSNNDYRRTPFAYSHLKTYKYKVFNKINRDDLIDPNTNEYYSAAWDHVLCMPMVEMSGIDRIVKTKDFLYILNRHTELQNEGTVNVDKQKRIEQEIRNKKPYERIYNL